jgi:hypothetical protein
MPKDRVQIPRQKMPTRSPEERRRSFEEVALGFDMDLALAEASRCLQCKKPSCIGGCPVQVRIPEFILALREGNRWGAAEALKDKNSLPAICGRVCPQETQCEIECVLGRKGEPVAVGRLERPRLVPRRGPHHRPLSRTRHKLAWWRPHTAYSGAAAARRARARSHLSCRGPVRAGAQHRVPVTDAQGLLRRVLRAPPPRPRLFQL